MSKPFWQLEFTAVDVETTGLSPHLDDIIEIGMARFSGGELVHAASILTAPTLPIPIEVEELTGISNDMVQGCPSPHDAWSAPELRSVFANIDFWVAYNAGFDRAFLGRAIQRAFGQRLPFLDPYIWLSSKGGDEPMNLHASCARFDIDVAASHRAKTDAIAVGSLLCALAPSLGKTS